MKRNNSKLSSTAVNEAFADKAKEIALVLSQPDVDLWRLRELAQSEGGLVNGTLCCARRLVDIVWV